MLCCPEHMFNPIESKEGHTKYMKAHHDISGTASKLFNNITWHESEAVAEGVKRYFTPSGCFAERSPAPERDAPSQIPLPPSRGDNLLEQTPVNYLLLSCRKVVGSPCFG